MELQLHLQVLPHSLRVDTRRSINASSVSTKNGALLGALCQSRVLASKELRDHSLQKYKHQGVRFISEIVCSFDSRRQR